MKHKVAFIAGLMLLSVFGAYAGKGYLDAKRHAHELRQLAGALSVNGRGHQALTPDQINWLIQVQDPGFVNHTGIDLRTNGAGLTTITQSLAKRLAFSDFKPGLGKIRQTAFAYGLESELQKGEILTLFLNTVPMGKVESDWIIGIFDASEVFYAKPVSELTQSEYLSLVAVILAPTRLSLSEPSRELVERIERIERLVSAACTAKNLHDVWLVGCTKTTPRP